MNQVDLPLLCRTFFRPGESLPSLLARLTTLNAYGSTGILKRLCLDGSMDDLDRPSQGATFERMAVLTRVPWRELYAATAHRFAETLNPYDARIEWLDISSADRIPLLAPGIAFEQLRPATAAQFCPSCLEESAYHRVAWIPIAVAVCLQHRCLLLDRCPGCWTLVTVQDIVDANCHHCGHDLRRSRSVSVEDDAWGQFSQQVIQAWLGLASMPEDSPSYHLPDQPPAVSYRLLDGLCRSIMGERVGWKYLHRIPQGGLASYSLEPDSLIPCRDFGEMSLSFDVTMKPYESYCLYATALKGLANWPRGFYGFLKAYCLREVKGLHRKLEADLGDLYSRWLERDWQSLAFVQDAFHQYLVDNYALSPFEVQSSCHHDDLGSAGGFTYTTVEEAARLLGVLPQAINRLVQAQLLFRYEFPDYSEEARYRFVRRAEVMELRARWANGVSLEDAARYLGLSQHDTLDLVEIGLLFAECGPKIDGSSCWLFSKQAVVECYAEVAQSLFQYVSGATIIDLVGAVRILLPVELDVAGILKCIVNGELHGCLPKKSCGLGEVMFAEANIRLCLERLKEGRKWASPKEIAQQMGVTEPTISRWVQEGLLSPLIVCGNASYFDHDTARRFVAGHVFDEKAAKILGVGVDMVWQWVREGHLKPVSGPGVDCYYRNLYRREDVERLRKG